MSRTVHIAGYPVQVDSSIRQLCGWCGETLIDVNLDNLMVVESSRNHDAGYRPWEMGALVAVVPHGQSVVLRDAGELPSDCCAKRPVLKVVR